MGLIGLARAVRKPLVSLGDARERATCDNLSLRWLLIVDYRVGRPARLGGELGRFRRRNRRPRRPPIDQATAGCGAARREARK
jgi:hypothetical protein